MVGGDDGRALPGNELFPDAVVFEDDAKEGLDEGHQDVTHGE